MLCSPAGSTYWQKGPETELPCTADAAFCIDVSALDRLGPPSKRSMTDNTQSRYGFVNFAETWNGRLAMLGFVIGLSTELLTGQGILSQLGFG